MQFFESIVEGNSSDSREHPGCVRRAFNAAVSASHMADHNWEYSRRQRSGSASRFVNVNDYVQHLAEQTGGAFRDVRSIANAYKHLYSKRTDSTVSSAGAIVSVDLTDVDDQLVSISEEYEAPGTAFGSVVFTRKDGSKAAFSSVLDVILEYWRREFYGSAWSKYPPAEPGDIYYRRSLHRIHDCPFYGRVSDRTG
jgi:hypothetical protein